jgi:hypothetical protein
MHPGQETKRMRGLVPVLSFLLVAGCTGAARPQPAPPPEPTPVAQVREALRLGGVAEAVAGAPMAVLPVAGPDGAALVVAERGRWWVRPDGGVRPADDYAERLGRELFDRAC